MPQFVTDQTLETTEPEIEVTVNPPGAASCGPTAVSTRSR
jgi:hypothetical protein